MLTGWRSRARAAILVAGAAFLAWVAWSIRPLGARPKELAGQVAETLAREATGIRDRLRFRDFVFDENREGGAYRIRASEALGFASNGDDVYRLKDVRFETRGTDGKTSITLRAPRAEFRQGTRALRVYDGVTMEGEAASLRGESFRFDPTKREFVSEGPVTMVRGRMLARADRGTLDTGKGRVLLEGKVRMAGTADEGRFLRFAAPVLAFERNGTMLASGGVAVATADAILRGETVERMPGEKGDLLHAAGDTTVLLVPPSPQRGPLLAAGDSGDLSRDADGFPSAMTLARASGDARLDVGPAGTSGPRRILAPRFEADFSAGRVSVVVAPAGLRGAEAVASDGKGGAGLRTLESAWGRFTFLPGSEDLDVAVFDRGVRLEDGTRSVVLAAKGTLRGPDETAVFSGDAGRPAEYRGENVTVRSRLLTWLRKEDRVEASGNVRTVFRGGTSTGLGGEPGEPYYSESDSLKMATVTRVATLEGNVRAWQKENVLRSTKLVLNDAERSVRAEGNVRSVFRRRATMPGPSSKTARDVSETVTASGDVLTHREAERTVRIEGNAKIVSGAWTMNATVADFRLTKDRAIEGAEARGAVALEDRATSRRGDGSLATWSPATETVTLEGTPATALDGKGNRMTGARLTFRQGQSRVDVESGPGVGSEGSYKPEGP